LDGKESIWVLHLADTLHEDGQVVMVVELGNFNFPCNLVRGSVLNLNGEISAVIETTELTGWDSSSLDGVSLGRLYFGLLNGLVERADLTTITLTFLEGSPGISSSRLLLDSKWRERLWFVVFFGHVGCGEITESRVLHSWLKGGVNLTTRASSSAELFKVILSDKGGSVGLWLHLS